MWPVVQEPRAPAQLSAAVISAMQCRRDTGAAIMCEDDVDYHMLVKAGEVLLENEGLVSAGDGTLSRPLQQPTSPLLSRENHRWC